ncbi:MAG TPA: hypothetical protein VK009_07630 [Chloroflexota bacterium]|nr:hypothetical protein [Chloroflexota bacterium]
MLPWRSRRGRSVLGAGVVAITVALLAQRSAAADGAPMSATVTITGRGGFSPPNVFIQRGGTVTWNNVDSDSHDVETQSAPVQFVLSMSPGQSKGWRFVHSGTYHYIAGTDCIWGQKALFPCLDNTVVVLDPGEAVPTPANLTPTPTPIPQTVTVQHDAFMQITDTGFVPKIAAIATGGTVSWINAGVNQHTATSIKGPTNFTFDTGGLSTSQFAPAVTLNDPGIYWYSSSTDCLHGVTSTTFDCTPAFIIVSNADVGTQLPIPSEITAQLPPTPTPVPGVAPAANTAITVGDVSGFTPRDLTIKLGQTVTWTNTGTRTHSVVSDLGVNPSFNLGGFAPQQTVAWRPLQPGVYRYHSSADDTNSLQRDCKCNLFRGTVTVGQ